MRRSEIREHVFKMVFQTLFHDESELTKQEKYYLGAILKPADKDMKEVIKKRFDTIMAKVDEVDSLIDGVDSGWKLERMSKVDLSILRVAVFEMKVDDDIPEKVAVNEAGELAKKYGGEESSSFINGVLAKLMSTES